MCGQASSSRSRWTEDFAAFHSKWVKGELPFGSWAAHLWSFAEPIAAGRVHVVSYDALLNDLVPTLHPELFI